MSVTVFRRCEHALKPTVDDHGARGLDDRGRPDIKDSSRLVDDLSLARSRNRSQPLEPPAAVEDQRRVNLQGQLDLVLFQDFLERSYIEYVSFLAKDRWVRRQGLELDRNVEVVRRMTRKRGTVLANLRVPLPHVLVVIKTGPFSDRVQDNVASSVLERSLVDGKRRKVDGWHFSRLPLEVDDGTATRPESMNRYCKRYQTRLTTHSLGTGGFSERV